MIAREQGEEKASGASENVIYKIEVPANRLDCSKILLYQFVLHLSGMICCVWKDSLEAY